MSARGRSLKTLMASEVFDVVATPRIADVIAERLTRAIRDGLLNPGDRLPSEQELAREFGVGRTSVREGLQKLRAHGLVESRKGLGAFVTSPTSADPLADFAQWTAENPAAIETLLETRIGLEALAAGLAALRSTGEDRNRLAVLHRAHAAAARSGDVGALVRTDEEFHEQIFAAAGNEILSRLYELLMPELTDFRRKTLALPWAADRSERGHAAILEAVQRCDSVAAREAMGDHLWILYTEVHDSVELIELKLAPRDALV